MTELERRFYAIWNPVLGSCDGESFWQWSQLGKKANCLFLVNHSAKKINHYYHYHHKNKGVSVLECQLPPWLFSVNLWIINCKKVPINKTAITTQIPLDSLEYHKLPTYVWGAQNSGTDKNFAHKLTNQPKQLREKVNQNFYFVYSITFLDIIQESYKLPFVDTSSEARFQTIGKRKRIPILFKVLLKKCCQ